MTISNIDSPPGEEKAVSDYLLDEPEPGARGVQVGMFPERPNVVARHRGFGDGRTIAFNAHMDTAWGPEERALMIDPTSQRYSTAVRDGDDLRGHPIVNDKGSPGPRPGRPAGHRPVRGSPARRRGGDGGLRRDRAGAGRRGPEPRLPLQGGRDPERHRARRGGRRRRGRGGDELRRRLGRSREGLPPRRGPRPRDPLHPLHLLQRGPGLRERDRRGCRGCQAAADLGRRLHGAQRLHRSGRDLAPKV